MRKLLGRQLIACLMAGGVVACSDTTDALGDDASLDAPDFADASSGTFPSDSYFNADVASIVDEEPAPPPEPLDTSEWLLSPPFYAAGDEPYWRLDAQDGWFMFQRLGLAEIDAPILAPEGLEAPQSFASEPLKLQLASGACELLSSSVRSDVVATVTFEEVDYVGCAFPGAPPVEAADDGVDVWTDSLASSLAPIDACLSAHANQDGSEAAAITALYPREGEVTAVVFQSASGRLSECGATSTGSEVVFLDPIEPGDAEEWMVGDVRFLRADSTPPPDDCLDAEPVFGAGDALIGYYLTTDCRL